MRQGGKKVIKLCLHIHREHFLVACKVSEGNETKFSPFHKTLPKSGQEIQWPSVRFYEMGVILTLNFN